MATVMFLWQFRLPFPLRRCTTRRDLLLIICCFLIMTKLFSWLQQTSPQTKQRKEYGRYYLPFMPRNLRSYPKQKYFHETQMQCTHKQLKLWPNELKKFFDRKPMEPLTCSPRQNWVYTANGKFYISGEMVEKLGEIQCSYEPLLRGKDDFKVLEGPSITPILNGTFLVDDHFSVMCSVSKGRNMGYFNLHSSIAYKPYVHKRKSNPLPKKALGLNVLMFGFDSVSHMSWLRYLPKSHDYFTKELGAVVLEGYNIVGDGTTAQFLPLLTGKAFEEVPESLGTHSHPVPLDNQPWIWNDFMRAGYATQWGEDGPNYGTFTHRMTGFKNQPVDHYMRPFYMYLENWKFRFFNKQYCVGSLSKHVNMMNWIKEFYSMYRDQLKFSLVFHSDLSHNEYKKIQMADDDLLEFLKYLKSSNILRNTVLIVMSDHGARFEEIRHTEQGKHEERMPYLGIRFPDWFQQKYPEADENLRGNIHKLTTPFDVHETLKDILHFTGAEPGDPGNRGLSLLKNIPSERTCSLAGISSHWCACLQWQDTPVDDEKVVQSAVELVNFINRQTEELRFKCEYLLLQNITKAQYYTPKKLKRPTEEEPKGFDFPVILFQVTVITVPNYGMYEASVAYSWETDKYSIKSEEISRINAYGTDPQCIEHINPMLRPYCYCRCIAPLKPL